MKTSRRSRLPQLLILALVASFIFTSTLGTRPTSAVQQSEADQAIAKADNALIVAQKKRIQAATSLAKLQESIAFEDPDQDAITSMLRLTDIANSMVDPITKKTLQTEVSDAQEDLRTALTALNTAKTSLSDAAAKPVEEKITAVKSINSELTRLVSDLNETLQNVYPRVKKVADAATEGLKPFTQNITEPNDLLNVFKEGFSDAPSLIQFDLQMQPAWTDLSAALKPVVSDHDTRVGEVNTAVTTLKTTAEATVTMLAAKIVILNTAAQSNLTSLTSKTKAFTENPVNNEKQAIADILAAQGQIETLDRIHSTAATIGVIAESANIPGFTKSDKTNLDTELGKLDTSSAELRKQTTRFQDLLSGDKSLWVTEKIRLYYFTDIPRLVQTLNPDARLTGGDPEARRRADDRLNNLRAKEDAQAEADGRVAVLKRQVGIMQQQLRQAQADLNLANIRAQTAARKNTQVSRKPEAELKPFEKEDATAEKDRTEKERDEAQKRFDTLSNAQSGLAADLAAAEAQLVEAQGEFDRASRATIRAAQTESAAFANLRDNAAFWSAAGVATSPDPARRVDITSSTNGENAIFIRGRREDVVKVQDIVAKLDEPAPQARMTLWKIELNSDATQKGAERFNDALQIVEEELAGTRAKIADTLSILLQAVSEEAEVAAADRQKLPFERRDCHEIELYEQRGFKANPKDTDVTSRYQRLSRYSLYSNEVREELGIRFIDELGFDNPKQFGLKDPGSATTLNEALIIMLLTDRGHRAAIMKNFREGLQKKFGKNFEFGKDKNFKKNNPDFGPDGDFEKLAGFRRLSSAFELDSAAPPAPTLETTRQQQELIYAIRGSLLKHLVGRIAALQGRVNEFVALDDRKSTLNTRDAALHKCLQEKLPKIFDTIHDEFPISPLDVMDGRVRLVETGPGTIGLQAYARKQPVGPPRVYNLRPSPARVAAADGMLDVFTKAFEDDVDRHFVQPMLKNLRYKLRKTGIGFGVIQRTSVLATNRLVARVDPRATAELSVGQETNLIQGLQQIAQLTLDARAGNIAGVFGQLGQLASRKDEGAEIFGITSGSAFQVTPIFDPTGQALRFKFDFVDTTLVRDPKGTTNPRIPRIERHTVNTEVQLANLELREISRFESDAKIGIPTTYMGGIPLLKDIPGVRPIPLIGWFVRRKGSNAIAQRSLIFAQTTMSPTIGDILDLFDTSLQMR
jgi:hypothetical protein